MAKNRVKAFKDVRNAPGGQDDRSQPTALLPGVLMGDAVLRREQSQQVPLRYTADVLGRPCIHDCECLILF